MLTPLPKLATATSSLPSPLKSPTATDGGPGAPQFTRAFKLPSPSPSSTLTILLPAFATARSSLPSPLKSPTAADVGFDPAWTLDVLSATEEVGLVISKKTKDRKSTRLNSSHITISY